MNKRRLKILLKNKAPFLYNVFYFFKYFFTKKEYCPFCNKRVPLVEGGRPFPRKHAKCVFCESLERHRFLFYIYNLFIFSLRKNLNILYFAPEKAFYELFKKAKNIQCTYGDIAPNLYKDIPNCKKIDALNICYPDKSFDVIIANHLVEHVDEDKFLLEIRRVLKDDGRVFLSTPIYEDMKTTLENPEYNTPELKKKYYGHAEHLRKYGADIAERFEKYFEVAQVHYWNLPPFGDKINSNCLILTKRK